jgi:hypothetical protein
LFVIDHLSSESRSVYAPLQVERRDRVVGDHEAALADNVAAQ